MALCNSLAALLSVAAALAACEAALRLLHPRYEVAANPPGREPSGAYHLVRDPDTGVAHRVYYNNLGGRQSRNFPADSLDGAVNIAFFGDSQTENVFMPAQYSFSEPLDFLLNFAAGGRGVSHDRAFNVLSFGTMGDGPARAYLRWRHLPVRRKLAHVFYMLVNNDRDDLRRHLDFGIVRLAESGEILAGGALPATPAWKHLLARLHLTYLAMDAWRRLADRPADDSAPATSGSATPGGGHRLSKLEVRRVLSELLRRWNREVQANGAAFHLVLLPTGAKWVRELREDRALRAEVSVFDLQACFAEHVPGFDFRDWSFANDPHWNPAANMVAASCLYRHLEDALRLPERTNEELAVARHAYYQAFLDSPDWEGERYMPSSAWARPGAGDWRHEAIAAKYLALELGARASPAWLHDAYAAGAVATSVWNVYVSVRERRLVYVKTPCAANWRPHNAGFFLHAVPFSAEKLPPHRMSAGFVNLDPAWRPYTRHRCCPAIHRMSSTECVFSVQLPDYPLARVTTGQFVARGEGRAPVVAGGSSRTRAEGVNEPLVGEPVYEDLWSATFPMPLARSVWEVRASAQGRGLDYVKARCQPSDTEARFFLHVHPTRRADLPEGARGARHVNVDFAWDRARGAVVAGGCRITAALPDFPIAFVRTGQFHGGVVTRRLWSVRIEFAEPSAGAARKRAEREGGGTPRSGEDV